MGGMIVHRERPLNGETPISELSRSIVTPNASFYVRNHFDVPTLDPSSWRLEIGGLVERPLRLSLPDLQRMPSQTLRVTMECAGNGRALLSPPTEGEPWGLGAVSTAEWTGVPLVDVLDQAGLRSQARELLFRGADGGPMARRTGVTHFERSLTLDEVAASPPLLAYAMNGEPLPIQHGYPLRLIVPGWYGVASVKWLTGIEVIEVAFTGYFQTERYYYEWERDGHQVREPVNRLRVRALITEPRPDQGVAAGDLLVRGLAWSGVAPIARVEVRVGGGAWQEARLLGAPSTHNWQPWELMSSAQGPGATTIEARATDLAGRTQPQQPEWNRLGYGSNAIQEVPIYVR
jgi:DMSO/TMAO reductase YedYZ molybdopterin-dependent catalytic subunit